MARLFFALSPDASARQSLADALPPDLEAGRAIPVANFHVTLAFLGDLADAQEAQAREVAAGVSAPAFVMRFSDLAFWPKPRLRVLLPETVPASAQELRARLAWGLRAHGIPFDARVWRPHVTVARRALSGEHSLLRPVCVSFREYVLMRSQASAQGSVYEPVARWPLASG
ncbi:RNA 2',3'-cyclic phosphodiesterase [Aquisalimonas sp.]|uniref:RNA 2',3'-cyclic phosphodiesterase n=1 Tax=Aquisalimonas sp. TaxID=1872621 RepID=UPI0025C240E8|nr:RNA 2',3'-cyclic phosphodiesterase [Aquisalimonas sp.]